MKEPPNLVLDDTARKRRRDAAEAEPGMTLGREAIFRINALEGLTPTKEMLERFADFDRRGLTPEQQRAEIIRDFKRER